MAKELAELEVARVAVNIGTLQEMQLRNVVHFWTFLLHSTYRDRYSLGTEFDLCQDVFSKGHSQFCVGEVGKEHLEVREAAGFLSEPLKVRQK